MVDTGQSTERVPALQNAADFAAAMARIGRGSELLTNHEKLQQAVSLARNLVRSSTVDVAALNTVKDILPNIVDNTGAWNKAALDATRNGTVSEDELAVSLVIEAAIGRVQDGHFVASDGTAINADNLMADPRAKDAASIIINSLCGCRRPVTPSEVRLFGPHTTPPSR